MKAPSAQEFPSTVPVVAATPRKERSKPTAAKPESVRRSYNLTSDVDDKINAVALKMSQKRGKVVSASEALRAIVKAHRVSA